jgi:hypothetical protein
VNCSDPLRPTSYFVAFDLHSYDKQSNFPKIYKNISYDPCPPEGSVGVFTPVSVVHTLPVYTAIIGLVMGKVEYIDWDEGCFFCAANGPDCVPDTYDVNASLPIIDVGMRNCRRDTDSCYPSVSPSATDGPAAASASPAASEMVLSDDPENPAPSASASASVTPSISPSPQVANPVNSTSNACDLKVYIAWAGTDANGRYLTSAGRRFSRFRQYGTSTLYQGAMNVIDDSVNIANKAIDYVQTIPGRLSPDFNEPDTTRRLEVQPGGVEGAHEAEPILRAWDEEDKDVVFLST